jgi:hypothetical protein
MASVPVWTADLRSMHVRGEPCNQVEVSRIDSPTVWIRPRGRILYGSRLGHIFFEGILSEANTGVSVLNFAEPVETRLKTSPCISLACF